MEFTWRQYLHGAIRIGESSQICRRESSGSDSRATQSPFSGIMLETDFSSATSPLADGGEVAVDARNCIFSIVRPIADFILTILVDATVRSVVLQASDSWRRRRS